MTWFTVQTTYAGYYGNIVSVEADTIEEALEKAIEAANQDPNWKSVDHRGPTFIDSCCMGRDADPWDRDANLPVPARFTEKGEPPLVTLTGPRPPGGVEVSGGTVRIRFADAKPANATGPRERAKPTVTTEVSDPPPPPGSKPVVIVRRKPEGAPDIEVRGGKALVRVEGWEGIDHAQT